MSLDNRSYWIGWAVGIVTAGIGAIVGSLLARIFP